ncbi:MAG: hypothetical protein WC310_01925 [Patescibacteria group bacterium]|jgi:hypothetical protein
MITDMGILYIEPSAKTSSEPVIDRYTRKMVAALRQGKEGLGYRGIHICKCGARSTNCDYTLPNGEQTNFLAVHYLAYHRDEVPQSELVKVDSLDCGEADPTPEELQRPKNKEASSELQNDYDSGPNGWKNNWR